jgi:hypothetical protein
MTNTERTLNSLQGKAAEGSMILNRLVPAPDHGAGFRRDPETGFVYYSSEWLGDENEAVAVARSLNRRRQNGELISEQDVEDALRDAKAPE